MIARFARASLIGNLFWTGSWDEGLRLAEAWISGRGGEAASAELGIRRNRARVRLARDDVDGALEDITRAVEGSRQMGEPQAVLPALGAAVRIYLDLGRDDEARELAAELIEHVRASTDWRILDFAFFAERPRLRRRAPPARRAAPAHAHAGHQSRPRRRRLPRSCGDVEAMGIPFAAADASRLAAARFGRDGHRHEAENQLEKALAFYRSVNATRYVHECEALRRR